MATNSVFVDGVPTDDLSDISQAEGGFGTSYVEPHPDRYLPVDAGQLPSRHGIPGVVVPVSTADGGRPTGFDPQAPQLFNVYLYGSNVVSVVDLAQVTPEMCEEAIRTTKNADPDIAAAAAFRKMGTASTAVKTWMRKEPVISLPAASQKPNEETDPRLDQELGEVPVGVVVRSPSKHQPAEKFAADPVTEPTRIREMTSRASLFTAEPAEQVIDEVVAPKQHVTFEIEEFGSFETAYHDVVRDGVHLILVCDTRWSGGTKYTPPKLDKPLVVEVHAHKKVYLTRSVGFRFRVRHQEFTVLLIQKEADV